MKQSVCVCFAVGMFLIQGLRCNAFPQDEISAMEFPFYFSQFWFSLNLSLLFCYYIIRRRWGFSVLQIIAHVQDRFYLRLGTLV